MGALSEANPSQRASLGLRVSRGQRASPGLRASPDHVVPANPDQGVTRGVVKAALQAEASQVVQPEVEAAERVPNPDQEVGARVLEVGQPQIKFYGVYCES